MRNENKLQVIIVETDLNDADMVISMLKSAGYAVRATRAETMDELNEQLRKRSPQLVLCTLGLDEVSLENTVAAIREAGKHIPVIAVAPEGEASAVECMQAGAQDLVDNDNREQFTLVVDRTVRCQNLWRDFKKLEAAISECERRSRVLLDTSRDSISYVHEGMHVYANESYLDFFGFGSFDDVEGMSLVDMVAPDEQARFKSALRDFSDKSQEPIEIDIRLQNAAGEAIEGNMEFSPATVDGEPCTQILIRNQADARELQDQLAQMSQRDVSTGLFNRKYFMTLVDEAIQNATIGQGNSALIQIEISNIQDIRNRLGVAATDIVISDIARILESTCKEDDALARFGEETFSILTTHYWEQTNVMDCMARLATAVEGHISDVEGKSVTAEVSQGAVQIDENSPDSDELLQRAEKTLTESRKREANRYGAYVPQEGEMSQKQIDRLWQDRLLSALVESRLSLVFQPIVSLHGDEGERYEVYVRLRDESGDVIAPGEFLPSAERTGVATDIDRWLIRAALEKLASIRSEGRDTTLFIKLSAGSLQDEELVVWLAEIVRDTRVPPANVVFQVPENVITAYLKQAKALARQLQELHCKLTIEDFGTGLKPFQLLKVIPADYLKVSTTLMENVSQDDENQEAVRTLSDTAHSMNKETIAPYVEDAGTLSVLWGLGVNYIQGNFLQEPSESMNYDFSTMG
ncbi:MAG: EAL domain-containing protein [Pseudomonadota bacterium]|nr:EAL domain-containing protein [Pseudomonadota bacterium]